MRLACNARGYAEPNPTVGCVIVKDGRVIGEGWTQAFGGPHAEPTALAACAESPEGATAYVTLEPCSHTNKKTPPCAPRLVAAKLARVVIGCLDPHPQVNGNGVAMLRAAGIEVDHAPPPLEAECKQLIAPFIAFTVLKRPYVTLKWAQTADGKVAGSGGRRMQISNAASSRLVHQLRARSDAILVGMGTVREDDPTLTARGVRFARPLIRAVVGSGDLMMNGQLLKTRDSGPVVRYVAATLRDERAEHPEMLERALEKLARFGIEVVTVPRTGEHRVDLRAVLADLHARGVTHLMVEPGPTLARSFIAEGLVDRLWVFRSANTLDELVVYSPVKYRGQPAPVAAEIPAVYLQSGQLDCEGDVLSEYLNPASAAYFATTPSADLVLARDW
ncbi:MAG: bifunctional diaminohydroxyphosphoribosylaminopyrimidine deaminase/5-amino-6-(5-phosphoribosylamino)uracil reductase RibD [Phycisphaerae bacterium]|nr:bifunctional diaminohydroxyphosphoribosylaminopyrimidine deaminase/5-amino-6-(5-phosphoribosylamino)uracil reductase RibD [Tepidisphaeraceae bacterium]